ncbi:hypothetical protein AB0I06_14800 [Streptomyces sp. NPDC050674]|uniref:hypothetical protein n=1 Tax=Streptomyces sp. NPDC050674 TaxID=3157216 RepID=UPI003434F161
MAETVPVRCPACRREHRYTAPAYPCVCGAPVAPLLDRAGSATPVSHRVWQDDWVTVRCGSCGRRGEWPRPEVGCACGVLLRVAVVEARHGDVHRDAPTGETPLTGGQDTATDQDDTPAPHTAADVTADQDGTPAADQDGTPGQNVSADQDGTPGQDATPPGLDRAAGPREAAAAPAADIGSAQPPFRSVTIRTALDAVTATALYLRWLGYRGVRRADQRPPSGIGLAARGVLAQVDPAVRPATLRDVECLWLTAMTESAEGLYFSLTGYADDARARADALGVPLFVLDLTGTPRPVNAPAETLVAAGPGKRTS